MFSSMLSLLGSLRGGATSFITNSLRFRSSASAYLSRTPSVAGNSSKFTWSGWAKRGTLGIGQILFGCTISEATTYTALNFNSSNQLEFSYVVGGVIQWNLYTSQVFRDTSAWYHIVAVLDTGNATASNRTQLYVNGERITAFASNTAASLNATSHINTINLHAIGRYGGSTQFLDGYLAEVHFIDGQALTPASFGAIDSSTGVWAPRPYSGTYGTNGFYLKFADASAATAAAIGKDSSGNGNNWTPNNISVTAGATYDSMIDVPVNYSDGGNGRGNYAVLNPLSTQGVNTGITNGNLSVTLGTAAARGATGNMFVSFGKWYFEMIAIGSSAGDQIGIISESGDFTGGRVTQGVLYWSNGNKTVDAVNSTYGASYVAGDIIGVALDNDAGSVTFYKNNISQGAISIAVRSYAAAICSSSQLSASGPFNINFGQRPFQNTTAWATLQAAGFRALNTNNLPTPSIVNGANFMAATTYTGTAGAQSILNTVNSVSFQPDLVWIKSRTPGATSHALFDSVRGTTKYLSSDTTAAETTLAGSLTAFNADGFSLGTATAPVNTSANSYIAWQWKESITAGLDIVSYTGTGANATIAHNLGVAPAMIIVKRSQTGVTSNWQVRHTSIAAANSIQLNSAAAAAAAATVWNSTAPTSSGFSLGTSTDVNASGISYVAYCFAEIAGFSRFGSYTGNGLADGPFVFCGFRPRFVMVKAAVGGTGSWTMLDTSRDVFNLMDNPLFADLPDTETPNAPNYNLDGLSNGFKLRTTGTGVNASGVTFIFAAFAEVPSKYALAR